MPMAVFDFVDAGSAVDRRARRRSFAAKSYGPCCTISTAWNRTSLVVEAGASPLEPYNGTASDRSNSAKQNIFCKILCASDPYAVVGVEKAFGLRPESGDRPGHQHVGGGRAREAA